jgi:CubicO group peptidase (beta-lactamase class C family)
MGLGWQIGNNYFDKNGGIPGYDSYMAFDPTAKIGIMVLGNTAGDGAGGALDKGGRELLGLLRDNPASPSKFPRPDTIPRCP